MSNEIAEFRSQLTKMAPEIARVLPAHVTPERFERVTLTALQRSPDLLGCDRRSLFSAVMSCAQDGLQPDGREAALVKFGGKSNAAAYMPMVAGLLKLARQSGEIASLTAQVVYHDDEFDYWLDEGGEHLLHRPSMSSDRKHTMCVYAMARTRDGEAIIEVMSVPEVEKVRSASRASQGGPWSQWWSEMARKTAIRRLFKRLPRSTDRLDQAVQRDDQFYTFDQPERGEQRAQSATDALRNLGNGDDGRDQGNGDEPGLPDTDRDGLPWDERIHSSPAKINASDGRWRRRRGVQDDEYNRIAEELRSVQQSDDEIPTDSDPSSEPAGAGESDDPGNTGEGSGSGGENDASTGAGGADVDSAIERMEAAQDKDTVDEIADEALNGTDLTTEQRERITRAHKRNCERLDMAAQGGD